MAHIKQTDRNNRIYELYLSGTSQVQIAAVFHLTPSRVHQIILRLRYQHAAAEGRLNRDMVWLRSKVNRAIKQSLKPPAET